MNSSVSKKFYCILLTIATIVDLSFGAVNPNSALNKNSPLSDAKLENKKETLKEDWAPNNEPQEFRVNVADGIQGANQFRYEKWDKGVVTGMYSIPLNEGKWEIINYIADDKGYRVTSTKVVDESELGSIQEGATAPVKNKANIDIQHQDGTQTSYFVTPDQINSNKKEELKKNSQ